MQLCFDAEHRLRCRLSLLIALIFTTVFVCQEQLLPQSRTLPDGEELLQRHLDATGGLGAHQRVKNISTRGSLEYVGRPVRGTIQVVFQTPDLLYVQKRLPGNEIIEEGCDGHVGWVVSTHSGARLKSSRERIDALRMVGVFFESNWKDQYVEAETKGKEQVNGQDTWLVRLFSRQGANEARYFDCETGLLVKIMRSSESGRETGSTEIFLGDYRSVGGIKLPHSVRVKEGKTFLALQHDKILVNTDISADRFKAPPEVKEILEKGASTGSATTGSGEATGGYAQPKPAQPAPAPAPKTPTKPKPAPAPKPAGK